MGGRIKNLQEQSEPGAAHGLTPGMKGAVLLEPRLVGSRVKTLRLFLCAAPAQTPTAPTAVG